MMRVSVAERSRLSVLIGRRAFRSLLGGINTHPLLRWRFGSTKTDRLVIAPQDLRTADATRASEIYAGRFAFAGKVVICDRRSPFEMTPPSEEWAVMLLSFSWLRHLRAADSAITRANARALIDDWINLQGGWHPVGWRVDILSRRVVCWLSQAPFVLQDADARFYRRFLRSLSRQVRYLRRSLKQSRDGLPRLQAVIALNYATLCMQGQSGYLRGNVRRIIEELRRQILPDGGHISRNPGALIELLVDLLPLRQLFSARHLQPPQALNNAIDRMMPMMRFFRHADGNFAQFNGMGPTPVDLLATVLAYDDARGAPVSNAPHSGYQRIDAGDTALLMDTGRPPPLALSQEAHAGCLSFELSWNLHRLVVNCGLPAVNKENWRQVARATAAHSTVTFNDASSCRFLEASSLRRLLFGMPIVAGPRDIRVTREDTADGANLAASHDGYVDEYGVIHNRALRLAADGRVLDGEDSFT
ncbi:MAG TPA: heparinase II/III family protein, partial [Pseudolabrys sp.]